ncbi:MAG: glucose-6-phosphate isomerase, partial [candidate division Zixibacteria bacterium]|nr:glucose-6-phosphate isomerase [candidate division Zixibacteria bacterium]
MLISKEVTELGDYQMAVSEYLKLLEQENIIPRIWSKDHTVWNPEPAEISNRLGWLDSPEEMVNNIDEINSFVEEVRAEGYTHALLLGMGGSSLAPEVFRRVFGVKEGWLNLSVLDSTDPAKVLEYAKKLNPKKTLVIASTKSGGTIETLSFVKYFYNWLADALGKEKAGKHYTAITDPGSGLQSLAEKLNFRKIFLNNPDIGGRYSALSYFGLVPAALVGIDIRQLLDRANMMAARCKKSRNLKENPGAYLGAVMGEMAVTGRDKLTLILSPEIAPIGAWLEQLIAESTGKEGKGILPIDGEVLGSPEIYSNDRYFVSIQIGEGNRYQNEINKLQEAGFPVIQLNMETINDLCGEFFHWELATIISAHRLQINPFDQPNVESAKIAAKEMMKSYAASGS